MDTQNAIPDAILKHEREQFVHTLLKLAPLATREHAKRLLRWGATYCRLAEEAYNSDWPSRNLDQDAWKRRLDQQQARAERIIRETCEAISGGDTFTDLPDVTPFFTTDPRGHTVRLQVAGQPLDAYGRPALAVPTS